MKSIGGLMVFLGLGSFVLDYLQREFILLAWVDSWGPTIAIAIRVGIIVLGAGLWIYANSQEQGEPDAE